MATAAVVENDYIVKDITQAEFGRAEIAIAETDMPGLMATRKPRSAPTGHRWRRRRWSSCRDWPPPSGPY